MARILKDSITQQVHQFLQREIEAGNIEPGKRIFEEKLAQQLGVSKTPLRLALHQLMQEGIVDIQPRRGIYLAVPTLDEFLELIEIREVLEGLAARRAALQKDRPFVAQMRACFAPFTRLNINVIGIGGRYAAADHRFHRLLFQASGSAELVESLTAINIRLHMNRLRRSFSRLRDLWLIQEEHLEIIAMIEEGNSRRAESLVRMHIRNAPWQEVLQSADLVGRPSTQIA